MHALDVSHTQGREGERVETYQDISGASSCAMQQDTVGPSYLSKVH